MPMPRRTVALIFVILLAADISIAQPGEQFLSDFLMEDKLKVENYLTRYNRFDFSNLWTQTQPHRIVGILGEEHERIKISLLSVRKDVANPNQYFVSGKSNVKGVIWDFSGTINLREIKEVSEWHFGVDDQHKNKGIKAMGILIASYEFKENEDQKLSGIFEGKLYSKWYLDAENKIRYDDIGSVADGYMNNAFVGIWRSYSTQPQKKCNWADYRVPQADHDFDIGAGEFSPHEKYGEQGWETYSRAWVHGDEEARRSELEEWWRDGK
jgi:hypothetical protein